MKGNKPPKTLFLTSVATLALVCSTTTRAQEATVTAKLNYAGDKENWRKLESKQIKIPDDPASEAKDQVTGEIASSFSQDHLFLRKRV